jgi:hypothetical protein
MPVLPLFLAGLPVVAYSRIDARHRPTGGCPPAAQGMIPVPADTLAICRDAEGGFCLFGCDDEWNVATDTRHPTLDDALHQAELEYEGVSGAWEWPEGRPG